MVVFEMAVSFSASGSCKGDLGELILVSTIWLLFEIGVLFGA